MMTLSKPSNFCYDISEIKITLKDTEHLERKFKNQIFYNIFNLKSYSIRKNCLCLYEIIYTF